MRSLFWRILATFWLALALVAGLSILLGRALNQDAWILSRHPGLQNLASTWATLYEAGNLNQARLFLDRRQRHYRMSVHILNDSGLPLYRDNLPPPPPDERRGPRPPPWRQITQEYQSPQSGQSYLFIYRISHDSLASWHQNSLLWPLSALGIALVVLTLFSLLLTLSITRPLNRLRRAVHALGKTAYQQDSLNQLARRRDELGVLAGDFNRMGSRLQDLIDSQRQLLRDVSHELRSPLARLKIAIALAENADEPERSELWPRLGRECDRLEALISEILALARLDADLGPAREVELDSLLAKLKEDALLLYPEQAIHLDLPRAITLDGWPDMLERALDNLLRNALRFNPEAQPIKVTAEVIDGRLQLEIRDHGPGVSAEQLLRLGEPFYRAPGQQAAGHGLGLAIARRAIERHGGHLRLANHPQGGFVATVELPLATSH